MRGIETCVSRLSSFSIFLFIYPSLSYKKYICIYICIYKCTYVFSSVQSFSRVQLFATPWITARQASLSITNSRSLFRLMPIESVMPSSHLILCRPLLLLPPIPPSIRSFPMSHLFAWGSQSTGVSASASVLPMNTQDFYLLQDGLVGSSCSSRDYQESSPTPQFKSINFSVLSFLHSPTLTSIHDHWKNHSLDQTDLCWQSNVSAF